jgi:hypothetical protein
MENTLRIFHKRTFHDCPATACHGSIYIDTSIIQALNIHGGRQYLHGGIESGTVSRRISTS